MSTYQRSMNKQRERSTINLGDGERMISIIAGAALIAEGLTNRSWRGWITGALGGDLLYRGFTGFGHLYQLLGVSSAQPHSPQASIAQKQGIKVDERFIVHAPPAMLFAYWRDFENLPKFMHHVESVRKLDDARSVWQVRGPWGPVEWTTTILSERDPEIISWRSLDESDVDSAGSIRFVELPPGEGTEVHVQLRYDLPGSKLGASLASLFGEAPEQMIHHDLQRFKEQMECKCAGEAPEHGPPTATDVQSTTRRK